MIGRSLFLTKFTLAFASVSYELLLAQWMSVLAGHTIVQYSLTVGLFLFSLGLGAWITARRAVAVARIFFLAECVLCLVMAVTPFIGWAALSWEGVLFRGALIWGYSAVITVGVITGFELPLFLHRFGDRHQRLVLAADYAGAVCAGVCFPFVFYYGIGLLAGFPVTVFGNLGALWGMERPALRFRSWRMVVWGTAFVTALLAAVWAAVKTIAQLT